MSLFGNKGPGGLSINTAAANSSPASTQPQAPSAGLFGQSKPAGSLFGASASSSTAGTLFGGSAAAAQPSNPFTSNAAATNSPAGTLFGGAAANSNTGAAASATGTSLFGNASGQAQTGSAFKGGLFGGKTTNDVPSSGSLFGSASTVSQSNQAGSLFGSTLGGQGNTALSGSTLTGQTQAQPTGSMWPPGNPQQQQNTNTSIFGSLNQQQPQQQQQTGGGLFGNSTANAAPNPFSAPSLSTLRPSQQPQRSIFSASIGQYTQAAQTVPGVRVDLTNLKPTTRFEDLTEEAQQVVIRLDEAFQQQMSFGDQCAAALPATIERGRAIAPDVDFIQQKLDAVKHSLLSDASAIDDAKRITQADAADASRSFRAIQAMRVPAQLSARPGAGDGSSAPQHGGGAGGSSGDGAAGGTGGSDNGQALVSYFSRRTDELSERLTSLRSMLREIEGYVSSAESQAVQQAQSLRQGRGLDGAAARSKDEKLRELVGVLREFERAIVAVAGNITKAREQTDELGRERQRGRTGLRY